MLLADAIEDYYYYCLSKEFTAKTMKNKQQEYKQFSQFVKDKRGIKNIEDITKHDLQAYIRYKQQDRQLQAQSIVSTAKQVKAFLNWCVQEEYISSNPFYGVVLPKLPKRLSQGLTQSEVKSLLKATNGNSYMETRNKAIIAIMADCGLRSHEVRQLKNNSIKDNAILVSGKGNKDRMVFISPELKRILLKYERFKRKYFKSKQTQEYYFLSYQGQMMSHTALHILVKHVASKAGVNDVHPHKLRHYYAVQAISGDNPIDIYSLSRLLGHSDISTTQRYLESLSNDELLKKALSVSPLSNF
ncbi:tyrosine-type recombinase/integrase [Barrientosiimonas marina]|uniref:Tyrosine-type recombinase/integrase n=1 Tax=Lentibacillus kimchii TaxID=1542911 RepID=A0ABW2UTK1_9BACI